jgi:hypothetical protein
MSSSKPRKEAVSKKIVPAIKCLSAGICPPAQRSMPAGRQPRIQMVADFPCFIVSLYARIMFHDPRPGGVGCCAEMGARYRSCHRGGTFCVTPRAIPRFAIRSKWIVRGPPSDVRREIGIAKLSFLVSPKFCVTPSRIPRFENTLTTRYGVRREAWPLDTDCRPSH